MALSKEMLQPDNSDEYGAEPERFTVARLRPLDRESVEDLTAFYELLTHTSNVEHFSRPPTDPNNLKEKLTRDNTHAYLAENKSGQVIGGGGINDAQEGEHDHWLIKVAVNPSFQGRGVGKQLLTRLIEEAFTTKTSYGRDRGKLVVSIIRDVEGWPRMPHILENLGFRPLHIMLQEVDVYVQESGKTVKKPTERWEIMQADWRVRRQKADAKRILSPRNGNTTIN